ncbi:MAG: spore germination protein GerW family protein [Armatimonadota bacterium]
MDMSQVREILDQVQANARVSTAIGEPVQVGDRVVLPVAEVTYGGGGGGGAGKGNGQGEGSGGGGGGGVRVRPLGCMVIGPHDERWVPAIDLNKAIAIGGAVAMLLLVTLRALRKRR